MGWNEQASSLEVNLVEDPCSAPATHPKIYYPLPGQKKTTTDADPGFVFPAIGAPVYFRVGDFEFAGVVQSWTRKNDTGGNPTFSVSITDPRFLLENLQLIVSDYSDSVENVYNLINVYGFLESLGFNCPESFIGNAAFGSPANAFGGARNNDGGTPWTLIRDATQALLTGNPHPKFSPYGFAVYRGNNPSNFTALGGMGALAHDSFNAQTQADFNSGGYLANYYIDISEIPFAPDYYRIAGPSTTLMSLVSQICDDAGCDFFVELLVTPSGDKIIKIRTAVRRVQPTLGQIESFVNGQTSVTTKNVGRELRNEPTSVFAYGGYIESLYAQEESERIHQYWGINSSGIAMDAKFRNDPMNMDPAIPEWWVDLDISPLTVNLFTPIPSSSVEISETEMRMAIASYDSWREYALFTGTSLGHWLAQLGPAGQKSVLKKMKSADHVIQDSAFSARMILHADLGLQNPAREDAEDMVKIHKFVANYAEEHYGKQFIAELPLICFAFDGDSQRFQFSDNPNTKGGFPAIGTTDILGLPYPSGTGIEFFYTEQDKINPILKYTPSSGSGSYTNGTDFIYKNDSLYAKGVTQEEIIISGGRPYALLTVSSPVQFSGLENGAPPDFGAFFKICLDEIVDKKPIINKDILGGKSAFALPMETKRITPDAAAIPMQSNTNRYGPWFRQGPPGPVTLVTDDNLVPWEYGGYTVLDLAATEKVKEAVTFMQVGERGSFTIPGYPIKGLGQEVRQSQSSMANFSVQLKTFNINNTTVQYWHVDTQPLDGTFGPNITQISTNVGSNGLTTTYNLATFTPSFGRMSKLNANRIKKVAAQRQDMLKEQRRQRKLSVAADQAARRFKQRAVEKKKAMNAADGVKNLFMAGLGKIVDGLGNIIGDYSATTAGQGNAANKASSNNGNLDWRAQAIMSPEGIYRPVSKFGGMDTDTARSSGFLPQYTRRFYNSSYEGSLECATPNKSGTNATAPQHATPPLISPEGTGYIPLEIYQDYLDPFASPNTLKHLASGVPKTGIHHDVDSVAFGGQNPTGQTMSLLENMNDGNAFPDDFRMMALRGPLLINGWGYDLEGKPVPNSADTVEGTSKGEFANSGLTNYFASGWLRRPEMWPVAPLDLRFDRARGVWTTPPPYRMLYGEIAKDIEGGGGSGPGTQTGVANIWNGSSPDDPEGQPLFDTEDPQIVFTNVLNLSGLVSGTKTFFHWDPNSCTYFPIVDLTGGGGGSDLTFFNEVNCNLVSCPDTGVCLDSPTDIVLGRNIEGLIQSVPTGSGAGSITGCLGDSALYINLSLPLENKDAPVADVFEEPGQCFIEYSEISIGSGLNLQLYRTTGSSPCTGAYIESTAGKHFDFGCQGEPAEENICGAGGGNGSVNPNSQGIIFGYGLDAFKATGTGTFSAVTIVNTRLKVEAPDASGGYVRRVETIDLGCGLSGTHNGTKCGSTGQEICSVNIELNPLSDQGTVQEVKLVNGICCTGAHITASFKTLRFSACGLFIEATGGTGCCD